MGRSITLLTLGLCVALSGRPADAQAIDIDAAIKAVGILNREGKAAEALKRLDTIDKQVDDAHRWAYHAHRGDALFGLRRPSDALVEYETSLEAEQRSWVTLRKVKALHVLGRWSDAIAILDTIKTKNADEQAEADTLRLICEGPFHRQWPRACGRLEATAGRYTTITDSGVPVRDMDAIEAKLAAIDTSNDEGKAEAERLLAPPNNVVAIARFLNDASRNFLKTLNIDDALVPSGVAFRAFIMSDEEAFNAVADNFAEDAHRFNEGEELVGLYSTSHKILVVRDGGDKPDAATGLSPEILRTLLHEAWHQEFDAICVTRPRWLDEGLAEYFAHTERDGNDIRFGALIREHPARADGRREVSRFSIFTDALERGQLPPLREFIATRDTFEQWEAKDVGLNYAYGWALAYYALKGTDETLRKAYLDCLTQLLAGGELSEVVKKTLSSELLDTSEKGFHEFFRELAKQKP